MFTPFKTELKYFIAIVENKSVSKAALALGLTQPQLSKVLQAIEDEVGTALFERTNRGLIINNEGRKLYEQITAIQGHWGSMDPEASGLSSLFRIGAHSLLAKIYLPRILAKLQNSWPAVNVQYFDRSSKEVSYMILERDLEVAIAANPSPLQDLILSPITKHQVGIYSAGQNDDILIVNPQLIQFSRFLKKVRYRKIIEVENYDIASLTAKQLGCHALLPEPAVAGSKFRQIKQLDTVDIKLVYREQNRNHPIIKLIKETLAEKTL